MQIGDEQYVLNVALQQWIKWFFNDRSCFAATAIYTECISFLQMMKLDHGWIYQE
jgi:hypothetical protein